MTNLRQEKKKKRPFYKAGAIVKAIRKAKRTRKRRIQTPVLAIVNKLRDPWHCLPLRSPSPARPWSAEIEELIAKAMEEDMLKSPEKVEPCGSCSKQDADGNTLWRITWISDTPSPTPSPPPSPPDVDMEKMFPNSRVTVQVDGFPLEYIW